MEVSRMNFKNETNLYNTYANMSIACKKQNTIKSFCLPCPSIDMFRFFKKT